jgi:hypothetical protein
MNTQRAIIVGGTALAIVIIVLIFFSPVWKFDSRETFTCDPPSPVSVYGLLNDDRNFSHSFQIRINTSSNLTIGVESYNLAPGQYIESKVQTSTKNTTHYYLTFTVDQNSTYQREVNASTYVVQSFDYNSEKRGIIPGVLFHSDYGC